MVYKPQSNDRKRTKSLKTGTRFRAKPKQRLLSKSEAENFRYYDIIIEKLSYEDKDYRHRQP